MPSGRSPRRASPTWRGSSTVSWSTRSRSPLASRRPTGPLGSAARLRPIGGPAASASSTRRSSGSTSASSCGSADDPASPAAGRPRPPGNRGTTSRAAGTSEISDVHAPHRGPTRRRRRARALPSTGPPSSRGSVEAGPGRPALRLDLPDEGAGAQGGQGARRGRRRACRARAAGPPLRAGRARWSASATTRASRVASVGVSRSSQARCTDARTPARVASTVRSAGGGTVRSGRSRTSAASVASSWARNQSTSGVDIRSTVVSAAPAAWKRRIPWPSPPARVVWTPPGRSCPTVSTRSASWRRRCRARYSPFGDLEFPLDEVPYEHPHTVINR